MAETLAPRWYTIEAVWEVRLRVIFRTKWYQWFGELVSKVNFCTSHAMCTSEVTVHRIGYRNKKYGKPLGLMGVNVICFIQCVPLNHRVACTNQILT